MLPDVYVKRFMSKQSVPALIDMSGPVRYAITTTTFFQRSSFFKLGQMINITRERAFILTHAQSVT